jgi:hypothetical protein
MSALNRFQAEKDAVLKSRQVDFLYRRSDFSIHSLPKSGFLEKGG